MRQRILQRKDSGQLFVVDPHISPRLFEQVFVSMSEQDDWLFRMIYNFVGEVRLVVKNQRDVILARNIFSSNDREFIPGNIAFERDVLDPGPRD